MMHSALEDLKYSVKTSLLPKHIGVIMDGNRRWAKSNHTSIQYGYEKGLRSLSCFLESCIELSIPYVSLYSFSTENWSRPMKEITTIFHLMNQFIENEITNLAKDDIRIMVSGDITPLPIRSQTLINRAIELTRDNSKLVTNFCLNYGSRLEILKAVENILVNRIQQIRDDISVLETSNLSNVTEKEFQEALFTRYLPDIDLMIRTAGELRLSNFLLYQSAYAELYFTSVLWPDFSNIDLYKSIIQFQSRNRSFGAQ